MITWIACRRYQMATRGNGIGIGVAGNGSMCLPLITKGRRKMTEYKQLFEPMSDQEWLEAVTGLGVDDFDEMHDIAEEGINRVRRLTVEIGQWESLAWLAGQDWVFFTEDGEPMICTNDVFAPAADAYEFDRKHAPELHSIGKDKGYDGLIDWIIAREGWKRWR